MEIVISDTELVERVQKLAEEQKQSPQQVIAAAIESYVSKQTEYEHADHNDGFWESIIGMGSSGDPTLAERDEEILAEDIDPIRGWGSPGDDTDTSRR